MPGLRPAALLLPYLCISRTTLAAVAAVLAFLAAPTDARAYTLAGPAQSLSPLSTDWNFETGTHLAAWRDAVTDPANFGPGGTVPVAVTLAALSAIDAGTLAGVDGFVAPWWADTNVTAAQTTALVDFFLGGGDLFLLNDDTTHDAIAAALGVPTVGASDGSLSTGAEALFGGPFGAVAGAAQGGQFGRLDSAEVLAANGQIAALNGAGQVTAALWGEGAFTPGAGKLVILTDVDMISTWLGTTSYAPLDDNGRFALNATAFLAVPEPSTALLFGAGLCGLVLSRRRRTRGGALALLLATGLLTAPVESRADTITHSVSSSSFGTQGFALPEFDPSLGQLDSVSFDLAFSYDLLLEVSGFCNGSLCNLEAILFGGNSVRFPDIDRPTGASPFGVAVQTPIAPWQPFHLFVSHEITSAESFAESIVVTDPFLLAQFEGTGTTPVELTLNLLSSVRQQEPVFPPCFEDLDCTASGSAALSADVTYSYSVVPEPSTAVLLGAGLLGLSLRRRSGAGGVRRRRVCLASLVAVVAAGSACSAGDAATGNVPSLDDARARIEARIAKGTEDGVEITALEKTDGAAGEVMGMAVYTIDFAGTLRVKEDRRGQSQVFAPLNNCAYVRELKMGSHGCGGAPGRLTAGETLDFTGKVGFLKKESGWVPEELDFTLVGDWD